MTRHNRIFFRIMCVILIVTLLPVSAFGAGSDGGYVSEFAEQSAQENNSCKNVILMIGDGMGFNSINKAVSELGLDEYNLQRMEYSGQSRTKSANNSVTDSAAGGTALACGIKTNNGCVGVYPDDINAETAHPQNLCEMALSADMSAGIVTTDTNTGATPAAFSVHTSSRKNTGDISNQQLSSGINLIWSRRNTYTLSSDIEGAGYSLIRTADDLASATLSERSLAQFAHNIWHNYNYKKMPTLSELTDRAIDVLDDDEDGFFLMVEGAHIDKHSHNNDGVSMIEAFAAFDNAVGTAIDYAETHSDTVVIVTADHETGGITFNSDSGTYEYTRTGHSGVNVPLFVYGTDAFMAQGEIMENTDIPQRIARLLNVADFPKKCYNTFCFIPESGYEFDLQNRKLYGLDLTSLTQQNIKSAFANTDLYVESDGRIGTGTKLVLKNSRGEVYDTSEIVVFGDVNGDGWYDGTDSIIVNCIANGILSREQVGEAVYMAADCNFDDVIDEKDVAILEQAGIILAAVDQNQTAEELMADSAYVEYLNLIDQKEKKDSSNNQQNSNSQNADRRNSNGQNINRQNSNRRNVNRKNKG